MAHLAGLAAAAAARAPGRDEAAFTVEAFGTGVRPDPTSTGAAAAAAAEDPAAEGGQLPTLQQDPLVLQPCGAKDGGAERLVLQHVQDPSKLHLFSKNYGTKCELWARVWSSSTILAEMLLSATARDALAGARVLEVGAGTAVCGLAAARAGAAVVVTDSSREAMLLAEQSGALSGVADRLGFQCLDWHSAESTAAVEQAHGRFEVLIGSDVLFASMNVQPVVQVTTALLAEGGLLVVIDPGRPTAEEFEGRLVDAGFDVDVRELFNVKASPTSMLRRVCLYLASRKDDPPTQRSEGTRQALVDAWTWIEDNNVVAEGDVDTRVLYTQDFTHHDPQPLSSLSS